MNSERPPVSSNKNTINIEDERARLRRNQRNSRARKQAYVQDLEKRWNECVRLGAQANVEMQREARRVQEENRLLRALLHKQGLDDTAIQEAIIALGNSEEDDIQLPAFYCSQEYLTDPSVDLTAPSAHNDAWPNGPQSDPQTLPQSLTFVDSAARLAVQTNTPQDVNLDDWLTDLCNIKDAFTVDLFTADESC
ncbi:hypothetical protein E0Z10_g1868 [Xylaria hypoxylon]|uniref:BZIP domain-containing protein n=1 Tax=Xylaria hypoxylon TaxID=37992 RepID=A0A4Z0Z5V8_9PEZI|nr:hypothetical protein E0Z10_g1868 [Xylaria hypoxylon]